jgi:hypothetical protein
MERAFMRRFRIGFLVLAAALFLIPPSSVRACPNCREAVSAQPADVANMARGYNWSIMLMLAAPFSLFCTGALMVRRAVKLGQFPEL